MGELDWILLIYAAGIVAMVIELFVPGAIMGIIGFLCVCASIIVAYVTGHVTTASVLIVVTVILIPVFFVLWAKLVGRLFAVEDSEKDFRSTMKDYDQLKGKEGQTVSPLRPSGTAIIEGERYAVVTRGEMLDKGTPIKVIDVRGSRLVVADNTRQ
ncbi:MAG: NfeD family protein [Candidatus Brocadiia bacterium]